MDAKLWSAVGLFIVCAVLNSIAFAKSTSAPLTNLEASLLQFFMWAAAVVLGLLVSWSLAERSVESAVRHRARPALRRVTALLEQMEILASLPVDSVSPRALARSQIPQIRAAAADWSELIDSNQSLGDLGEIDSGRLSWDQFAEALDGLANLLDRGEQRGGFRPTVIVGIYPEGGMIGYLLWLRFGRRCPVVVIPDTESRTIEESAQILSTLLPAKQSGAYRALLVDASFKSGRTMQDARAILQGACDALSISAEISTMVVVDYTADVSKREEAPDFSAVKLPVDLPFALS